MPIQRWSGRDSLSFAGIGLAELLIFFNNPRHFFTGDSLLWMSDRYRSFSEFLAGFLRVDETLWYRPLAQRTVASLLFPMAGLHPIPYRIASFMLFFACTIAVFLAIHGITRSRRIAWISTLFYVPHVTHAFATYDVAFTTELLWGLFFLGSVIAWISYLDTGLRKAWIASCTMFVASLLSKETAVALPFTLFALWLFLPPDRRRSLRTLAPHFAILTAYLVLAIGFLHIRGIDIHQLVRRPGVAGQTGYELVLGRNVLQSVRMAFTWAFNIPRGVNGQWPLASWMLLVLKTFRILVCTAGILMMFTPRRRYLLIGMAWFFIAASPTLPLLDHFLPYYLFVPLAGFSLMVGTVLDGAAERIARRAPVLAWSSCGALLLVLAVINAGAASGLAATHFILGGSAESARNGMMDLKALHPTMASGTRLVIFDEETPGVSWNQAHGKLYQMAYHDDSIATDYITDGDPVSVPIADLKSGKAFALKLTGGHLVDFTSIVVQKPELLNAGLPIERYHLELSKYDMRPGGDNLMLRIPELRDTAVNFLRTYNGIVEGPVPVSLGRNGQAEVAVSGATRPGTYTFVAVQRAGSTHWVTVSGTFRVPPVSR